MRRKDEHLGPRRGGKDLARGLQAVEKRHRNVHDDDVGTQRNRQVHGLASVAGLRDDLDSAVGEKEGSEALPHNRVVVGQQGPN